MKNEFLPIYSESYTEVQSTKWQRWLYNCYLHAEIQRSHPAVKCRRHRLDRPTSV